MLGTIQNAVRPIRQRLLVEELLRKRLTTDAERYVETFRRAAVDITFEGKRYFVVPHDAILLIVRDREPGPREE